MFDPIKATAAAELALTAEEIQSLKDQLWTTMAGPDVTLGMQVIEEHISRR